MRTKKIFLNMVCDVLPYLLIGIVGINLYSNKNLDRKEQYVSQNTIKENKELANIFKIISIQEMRHLDIVGELLINLGFIPYFMGKYNNKWCSDNVIYRFDGFYDILKINISNEKKAIKEYKRLIDMTDDDRIKMILSRIVIDEEMHVKIFNELLENK